MKETLELELSLEHINEDLIDINCDVEIEVYGGSNTTDDPSEIEIISITSNVRHDHSLNGSTLLWSGDDIKIDAELTKQIINKYERLIS